MCDHDSHDALNGAADPYGFGGQCGDDREQAGRPHSEQNPAANPDVSPLTSTDPDISVRRLSRRKLLMYAGSGTAAILASPLVTHSAASR